MLTVSSDSDGVWEELCVIMVCLQCVRYQNRTQQDPRDVGSTSLSRKETLKATCFKKGNREKPKRENGEN